MFSWMCSGGRSSGGLVTNTTVEVVIPNGAVGSIIGKSGSNIAQIRQVIYLPYSWCPFCTSTWFSVFFREAFGHWCFRSCSNKQQRCVYMSIYHQGKEGCNDLSMKPLVWKLTDFNRRYLGLKWNCTMFGPVYLKGLLRYLEPQNKLTPRKVSSRLLF